MDDNGNKQRKKFARNIFAQLEEVGVNCDLIKIEIDDEGRVVLRGDVCSLKEKDAIHQIITDSFGIEEIRDELTILEGIVDEGGEPHSLYEEEDDSTNTEDISRAIEDGIPYTPPSEPVYRKQPEEVTVRKKKNKKNKSKDHS